MKTILLSTLLFCVIALPALGELTVEDIEKIDTKIQASETRMKEHITQQADSLKTPITWLIGILVAIIALIGLPLVFLTIIVGWRSVKDNSQEKQIETLTQEIEMLKQQRIVNP
jgi:cell division protein FtsB